MNNREDELERFKTESRALAILLALQTETSGTLNDRILGKALELIGHSIIRD